MNNVNMTYDLDIEFSEYQGLTSTIIFLPGLEFAVTVSKNHATGLVTPEIAFLNFFGSLLNIKIMNFPSNPYTQLISKEVGIQLQFYSFDEK